MAGNWPSFRGPDASGVADGMRLPDRFDGEHGRNVRWKAAIPGLAHSSPIVWGDKLFVTTAVSSDPNASFQPGLYGEGTASEDRSVQRWRVYCLDKKTGKLQWERTAYEGVPREKRHIKATYANSTPATDGRYVVAFFGSQGLYAYDMEGNQVWKRDLGRLNTGAYDAPEYEWGNASSPILFEDLVIVQCDTSEESFVLALNASTGKTVWKAERDELPSWATPAVYRGKARAELVTNAPNFIRGYDPRTGSELWRLGGSSKITAPTPVFANGLIVVASGRRPEAPLFAVRAGSTGDITLRDGKHSNRFVAWHWEQRGPYMPTPLIYRGYVYALANQGILDCYGLEGGKEVYRRRIPHHGSGFSASPVAADGRLYLSSEDGDIFVVRAGPQFAIEAVNPMGESLMATPALSDGMMFVRGTRHVFAVGR